MACKASCCARRPKTSDPGVAKLVEAAEPGGGGQETRGDHQCPAIAVAVAAAAAADDAAADADATIERSACCRISSSAVAIGRSRQGHRGDG